jgi:muramoyltetrapeptide carboxypeptidase
MEVLAMGCLETKMRIGICAPSATFTRADADKVIALAALSHPSAELVFHDQCFLEAGHFAGTDQQRHDAFVALANDPAIDAIWFARGGYGACRFAAEAVTHLGDCARDKVYLGYSDGGNVLAALYRAGIGFPTHGPMVADIRREVGEAAVCRALDWLVDVKASALEPHIDQGGKYAAFNLMTLAMLVGTQMMPDLRGHVVMIEEVSEYLYAFDRAFFHVGEHLKDAGLVGLRLGRVSDIPENDRPFGEEPEAIARRWCAKYGIAYLGGADIGHDVNNKVVPFGLSG